MDIKCATYFGVIDVSSYLGFIEARERLEVLAEQVARMIEPHQDEKLYGDVDSFEFEAELITVSASYHRRGQTNVTSVSFPPWYLWDLAGADTHAAEAKKLRDAERESKQAKLAGDTRARRHAEYLKLKAEFEDGGK